MADGIVAISKELKDIERKKAKSVRKNDYNEVSRLCNSAGELLFSKGFFAEAIEWHTEEVNYSEIANDTLGIAIGHRKIGECLCELNQFEDAIKHQRKHLKLSQSVGDKVEEQRALATLGRTLFLKSDSFESDYEREKCLNESLECYLKSFSLSNKLREQVSSKEIHEMRARLCLNMGLVYEWKNQLDQAEKYMEKALISSRENGLKDNMYRCFLSLSGVTAKNKKIEESLRLTKRAQHLAKEKGDKTMEADAVFHLAQLFVKLGSFTAAVKLFHQSYKLNKPKLESDKESFFEALSLAKKGERYSKQLDDELDDEERLKIVEKLGDLYSEAKASEKALFYYQQQLELCEKLKKGSRNVAAIYISLAITHAENGDIEKALEFYRKELALRERAGYDSDFKEMSATYSAIAKLLEDSNSDRKSVEEMYGKAVEFAEKSGSTSCLINVYKELSQTLRKFNNQSEFEQIEEKIRSLGEKADEEEEDDDIESIKKEDDDFMDFEELLQSSDSSDDEMESSRSARLKRNRANKVNEKGETPLHVACIAGDINKAKDLLQAGATVHARDFCGWQPLHEACNFGHTEIAKLLLLYGANVNDQGGDHCGHVTPLHDASQNGHIETVRMLVERGADLHAKDKKGRTPFNLVDAAIKADEEELEDSESDVLENRKIVRAYLKQEMLKSRPVFQIRNRNILDDFRDMDDGHDDKTEKRIKKQTRNINYDDDNDEDDNDEDDDDVGDEKSNRRKNLANNQIEDDSESWPNEGFERTDTHMEDIGKVDSNYASMDEDGGNMHLSSLKPIEPLGSNELNSQAGGSSNQNEMLVGNYAETETVVANNELQTVNDEDGGDMNEIEAFRSESDSSDAELIDGFIIDDVGQSQARKKRRLEGFPRKKTVQQKLVITGQSASYHPKKRISEKGSKSNLRSRSKSKVQSKLNLNTTSASRRQSSEKNHHAFRAKSSLISSSEDRSFTVNPGICNGSRINKDSSCSAQALNRSMSQRIGNEIERSQVKNNPFGSIRIRVRVENKLLLIPCIDHVERKTIKWLAEQASQRYSSSTGLTPHLSLKTMEGALLSNNDFVSDVLMNNEEVNAQVIGWISGSICEKYGIECAAHNLDPRAEVIDIFTLENELCNLNLIDFHLNNSELFAISRALAGHSRLSNIDLTGNYLGDDGIECLCGSIKYLPSLVSLNLSCTGMTSVGLSLLSENLSLGAEYQPRLSQNQARGPPLEELISNFNRFDDFPNVENSLFSIFTNCLRLSKLVFENDFLPINLFSQSRRLLQALKDCKNLTKLSLAGNAFLSTNNIFKSIPSSLQQLNLSECQLDSNDTYEELNCHSLHSIILQGISNGNNLNRFFQNGCLTKQLQYIDISNSDFDKETVNELFRNFANLHSIRHLNTSGIDIIDGQLAVQLLQSLVSSSSTLSALKMTSCNIETLTNTFIQCCVSCLSLNHVDLSFNRISLSEKEHFRKCWHKRFKNARCAIDVDLCIISNDNFQGF